MNDAETLKRIGTLVKAVASQARRLSWNLAQTNPDASRRTARARVEKMTAEHEPFRRMGRAEHERVEREIEKEEAARRRMTASAARWGLEPLARELEQLHREFVARCRRDTSIDFPQALDRMTPGDMLTFELLKETLRSGVEHASADELFRRYERVLQTKDARSLIEAELIERRVERGGLAETPEQLPAVKRLREFVEAVQEMRLPTEQLADVPDTIEFARKQISLADLAYVKPLALDHPSNAAAKLAFEAEAADYADALAAAAGDE